MPSDFAKRLRQFWLRFSEEGSDILRRVRHCLPALTAAVMVASLPGCATYRADPLNTPEQALTDPDADVLAAVTAAIDTPYLVGKPVDLSAPLDRDDVALIALARNPNLLAMRARAGVAEAQVLDAGLLPDPTVGLSGDRVVSGPATTLPTNLAGQIALDINALRTRGARRDAADSALQQVRLDLAWAEWQVVEAARLQAVRVHFLSQNADLAEANRSAAQDLLNRYLAAAGRGDIGGDQVQAARIALTDAIDRANTAQLGLVSARRELNRVMGLPPQTTLAMAAPHPLAQAPAADRLLAHALDERFDLAALRAGYASQEAGVRLAILEQFPSLNLGFSFARDSSNNGLLGALLDFALPSLNANRGQIAIERATRTALKAEYDARLFATRADLEEAQATLAELARQYAALEQDLPEIARYAAATRRAADRGDLALATAIAAEQTLRDRQLLLLSLEQSLAEQVIALELASQLPVERWN